MPDYKPVVIYDFAEGHMAERLTATAVEALKDVGHSNAAQELFMEMNRYLKNKDLIDADPKHMFPIFAKYVEIWPTSYFAMEKVVGKELAREWVPRKELIPDLTWVVQDYLDHKENREALEEVRTGFKNELDDFISGLLGTRQDFFQIAVKWLHRAGLTASDALTFVSKKAKKKTTAPAKVAA